MKRAGLILNPKAGRGSFEVVRHKVTSVLTQHGFAVQVQETTAAPGSARTLAQQARDTCDLVIACGGDGTVHGVLQGLAGTSTTLGVLPLGTANALARNLQLPLNPVHALQKLLTYKPQHIPLGYAETSLGARWFTVMAGAGPDGHLVQGMPLAAKARFGRWAYYTKAIRLYLTRRFPPFQVEYRAVGSSRWQQQAAIGLMVSRVSDLGGLFTGLTRASRLHHPHLLVQLLRAPAHLALPAWVALGKARLDQLNPWLTRLEVEELKCTSLQPTRPVYTQVDAEPCGPLPLTTRVVPAALHLLMPS